MDTMARLLLLQFGLQRRHAPATLVMKDERIGYPEIKLMASERSVSGEHSPGSMNHSWSQQSWQPSAVHTQSHFQFLIIPRTTTRIIQERAGLIRMVAVVTGLHRSIDPLCVRHDLQSPQRFPACIILAIHHPPIPPRRRCDLQRVGFPPMFIANHHVCEEVLQALLHP